MAKAQQEKVENKKKLKVTATSSNKKCVDLAFCNITVTKIKVNNVQYLETKNKKYTKENNSIKFTPEKVAMLVKLPNEIPEELLLCNGGYIDEHAVENGEARGTVVFQALLNYLNKVFRERHQRIVDSIENGDIVAMKTRGVLNKEDEKVLESGDEEAKRKVKERLLKELGPYVECDGTFQLTSEGVIDLSNVSRGTVAVDRKTYVSNVLADGDGRDSNLRLASEALAIQRLEAKGIDLKTLSEDERNKLIKKERIAVDKWMAENKYTWHEIDDKAIIQKVPTHLHSCIRHAGGVALVSDKYDCYNRDLQLETASRALIIANGNLEEDKEKLNSAKTQQQKEAAESQIKETEERIAYLCSLVGNGTPSGTDSRDVGDGNAFNVC